MSGERLGGARRHSGAGGRGDKPGDADNKLNTIITKLGATVESLTGKLETLTGDNSRSHARLHGRIDGLEEAVDRHEVRLALLERRGDSA